MLGCSVNSLIDPAQEESLHRQPGLIITGMVQL